MSSPLFPLQAYFSCFHGLRKSQGSIFKPKVYQCLCPKRGHLHQSACLKKKLFPDNNAQNASRNQDWAVGLEPNP